MVQQKMTFLDPAFLLLSQFSEYLPKMQQTEDKKKKEAAADKAYKDALRSIPDQKVSDPWAKIR
jgi:hypothetical protein